MPPYLWLVVPLAIVAVVCGRVLPQPGNPAPLANRLAYQIGTAAATVLIAALGFLAPEPAKGIATAVGALLGLATAWVSEWRTWPEPAVSGARLGIASLATALVLLIWPDAVVQSYGLAGMAAALAACQAFAVLYGQVGIGTGVLAGFSLLALGSLGWLGRLGTLHATTSWLVTASAAAAGLAASGWAWPNRRWLPPLGAGAAAALALVALPPVTALHPLPALCLGIALAVGLALVPAESADRSGTAVVATIAAAATLLLSLRLGGVATLSVTGLGLIGLAGVFPLHWGGVLLGVAGARLAMQLFLARMDLTDLGIDLTHTYAFVGLLAGVFWPLALATLYPRYRARRIVLLPLGWSLVLTPVLLGFLLHVEPLASFACGLFAMAIVLGFMRYPQGNQVASDLSLPLLSLTLATGLVSAQWLVTMINATRYNRAVVLVVLLLLVAIFVIGTRAQVRSTIVDPEE